MIRVFILTLAILAAFCSPAYACLFGPMSPDEIKSVYFVGLVKTVKTEAIIYPPEPKKDPPATKCEELDETGIQICHYLDPSQKPIPFPKPKFITTVKPILSYVDSTEIPQEIPVIMFQDMCSSQFSHEKGILEQAVIIKREDKFYLIPSLAYKKEDLKQIKLNSHSFQKNKSDLCKKHPELSFLECAE